MRRQLYLSGCALGLALLANAVPVLAEDLGAEETQKAEAAVKELGSAEEKNRAAAETELRGMGARVLPVLIRSKVEREDGNLRLRAIIVDLALDTSKVSEADARTLMEVARTEALAKRYSAAERCYRRAEKIYDRLKDDAGDRKDKVKKHEFDEQGKKADRRADRAGHLAQGDTHKGLNLGFVKIGKDLDLRDDDW